MKEVIYIIRNINDDVACVCVCAHTRFIVVYRPFSEVNVGRLAALAGKSLTSSPPPAPR